MQLGLFKNGGWSTSPIFERFPMTLLTSLHNRWANRDPEELFERGMEKDQQRESGVLFSAFEGWRFTQHCEQQ